MPTSSWTIYQLCSWAPWIENGLYAHRPVCTSVACSTTACDWCADVCLHPSYVPETNKGYWCTALRWPYCWIRQSSDCLGLALQKSGTVSRDGARNRKWESGGFKHDFYFPFHIWDVILPIDFHIFQDGYCTTNQHMFAVFSRPQA